VRTAQVFLAIIGDPHRFHELLEGIYEVNHDAYRQGGTVIEGIGYFQTKPVALSPAQPEHQYQDIDLAFPIAAPPDGSEFAGVSPSQPVVFAWAPYYLATNYMVAFADSGHFYLGHLESTLLTLSTCNGTYIDESDVVRPLTAGEYYWYIFITPPSQSDFNDIESTSRQICLLGQPPDTPSNVSPADGASGVSLTPTLESSAFSDPDAGDTQAASQWQITATPGDYSGPVFDSDTDGSNLTSITIPMGILDYDTTYYWHVRHQDNHSVWSNWSAETSFSTTAPLLGDATGDGIVDALDVTKVERIIAGLDAPTPGADANQDGKINALDITQIERIIAELD
jgi:hypothetical protein